MSTPLELLFENLDEDQFYWRKNVWNLLKQLDQPTNKLDDQWELLGGRIDKAYNYNSQPRILYYKNRPFQNKTASIDHLT